MYRAALSPSPARMHVALAVALLFVTVLHVGSASAVTIVKEETRAKTTYFEAASCRAPATVSLGAPADASVVEPASVHLGATVTAYDTYWETQSFATITAVEVHQRSGRPAVVWTATPHPEMCNGDPVTDWGWYSVERRSAVSYRIRHQVRLSRRDAADLAEEARAASARSSRPPGRRLGAAHGALVGQLRKTRARKVGTAGRLALRRPPAAVTVG